MDINDAWKSTCKIVLGGEVGELKDYEKYLLRYVEPIYERKSFISGKKVIVSLPQFSASANFISNEEMGEYNRLILKKPLNINSLKDIDSLLGAIAEEFSYAGNQITGNSSDVSESDNVLDSHEVFHSSQIAGGKFIAYSSMCRFDEFLFGVNWSGQAKYCIKCFETYQQQRCMETISVWSSSDCYYCGRLEGCDDCLFSFNNKHKRHLIGNRQFERGEYLSLKSKLLEDMRGRLRSRHEVPSIIDIMGNRNG